MSWFRKKPKPLPPPAKSTTVAEFMDADFIIPTSGGSMAHGYTGTKEDADKFVRKIREAHQ